MWALWPEMLGRYATPRRHRGAAARRDGRRGDGRRRRLGRGLRQRSSTWPRPCSTRPGTGSRPDTGVADPQAFEAQALAAAGVASTCAPRYRTTYFQHIFAGGYAAGYYSYIWREVLDADTVEWFNENGGLRRENGDVFRGRLLVASAARWTRWPPPRGARPRRRPRPLLRRRGLVQRLKPLALRSGDLIQRRPPAPALVQGDSTSDQGT